MPTFRRKTTGAIRGNAKPVRSMADRDTVLMTEHEVQREFVKWFRQTYAGVRIFAIPNGGYRSKSFAMKLKAEGVSKGVPDLFVPEMALWIEMKREKGGVVSAEQKDWMAYLDSIGYHTMVCRGLDDAKCKVMAFTQIADRFRPR